MADCRAGQIQILWAGSPAQWLQSSQCELLDSWSSCVCRRRAPASGAATGSCPRACPDGLALSLEPRLCCAAQRISRVPVLRPLCRVPVSQASDSLRHTPHQDPAQQCASRDFLRHTSSLKICEGKHASMLLLLAHYNLPPVKEALRAQSRSLSEVWALELPSCVPGSTSSPAPTPPSCAPRALLAAKARLVAPCKGCSYLVS